MMRKSKNYQYKKNNLHFKKKLSQYHNKKRELHKVKVKVNLHLFQQKCHNQVRQD